jgi:hypothetical protein
MFVNVFGILLLAGMVFNVDLLRAIDFTRTKLLMLLVGIGVLNYILLVSGQEYRTIEGRFKGETTRQARVNLIYCWIFIIGTFVWVGVCSYLAPTGTTFLVR